MALLNPNIIMALLRFAYKGSKAKYEKQFRKALDIAAPDNTELWMNGLNAFHKSRDRNGKMTNEIATNILFIASNGDKERFKEAVEFFNANLHRRSKFSRYKKWLWLIGPILFTAGAIIICILDPGIFKVLF